MTLPCEQSRARLECAKTPRRIRVFKTEIKLCRDQYQYEERDGGRMLLKKTVGIIINRLTVGFVFAFVYQAITGIATSALSIPLTGTIQDLILGIESADANAGIGAIIWWAVSSVMFTLMATHLVRYRRYISPYKEKGMNTPPDITLVSLVILGATMSFLFFLTDLTIGATQSDALHRVLDPVLGHELTDITIGTPQGDTVSDVQTIYVAAISGDFGPLGISLLYSLVAGFVVVWVIGRAAKVKKITRGIGEVEIEISDIKKKLKKKTSVETMAETTGMAPGTLIHIGTKKVNKVQFSSMRYGPDALEEDSEMSDISEWLKRENRPVNWLNMVGVHDAEMVGRLGDSFGIHRLYQADIMNTKAHPSLNVEDGMIFLSIKMPRLDKDSKLVIEHVSIVLTDTHVISFQESEGDVFDRVRENIRQSSGNFRIKGNDYLLYALIDAVVDNYFVILEDIGNRTEELEHRLMANPGPEDLETIYALKRQMIALRKSIWPMREVINSLEGDESSLIEESTRRYLRDVYNHTIQTMDTIESLRDMVGGMLDTYLSSMSNKMNEVMKTLTIIASIFIPITFIAGIYGTNFAYVPELELDGGYFIMLGAMAVVSGFMVAWFRRKSWL